MTYWTYRSRTPPKKKGSRELCPFSPIFHPSAIHRPPDSITPLTLPPPPPLPTIPSMEVDSSLISPNPHHSLQGGRMGERRRDIRRTLVAETIFNLSFCFISPMLLDGMQNRNNCTHTQPSRMQLGIVIPQSKEQIHLYQKKCQLL